MKKMVIVGWGDHALDVADALLKNGDDLAGFLDDTLKDTGSVETPYLGNFEKWQILADQGCLFICGISALEARERLAADLPQLPWTAVVHPSAVVGLNAQVAPGAFVGAGAVIGAEASVGAHTVLEAGCLVGSRASVGDFCQLLSRVNVGSGAVVGRGTFIGQSATLKNGVKIADNTVIQTGEIVVKDMVMKMVFKRGAWIYKENG